MLFLSPPVVRTSAYEAGLLRAKPLTFGIYQEALHAFAACATRQYPGLRFSFPALPGTPYLDAISYHYVSPNDAPISPTDNTAMRHTVGLCFSEYAVAVAATWQIQNKLTGAVLDTQRVGFLSCMRSAGVSISASATFAQIHTFFDTSGWSKSLNNTQSAAATVCQTKYAPFLGSL